jgi:hypothetical protein
LPSATIAAGPCDAQATTGSPAGDRLDEHEAERLTDGGEDEEIGRVQGRGDQLVRSPAGEEHMLVPEARCRGERVLPFPLAGVAADEHERRGRAEPLVHAGVGGDQERKPLHGREARRARLRREPPLAGRRADRGRATASAELCVTSRSDVLLGPTPGRCGSSRQLARTARREE